MNIGPGQHKNWQRDYSMQKRYKAISGTSIGVSILLMYAFAGCSTTTINWQSIQPAFVSGDRQWTLLAAGMTEREFVRAMSANGYIIRINEKFSHGYAEDSVLEKSMTAYSSYGRYEFESVPNGYKLLPTPVESSCSYAPDEGGAFESIFSISKERTKELFANSAAPLGFVVGENISDIVEERSWWTLRTWPTSIEEMLGARFEEVSGGTKVVVNTESDRLALKGRDISFARSILEHMYCTISLLSIDRVNPTELRTASRVQLSAGQKVQLVNYRVLSSASAIEGATVEFLVAADIKQNGNIVIPKGAPVLGEITKIKFASEIHVDAAKVQAIDGQWYDLVLDNGPLILTTPVGPDIAEVDKSKAIASSAHIVYQIGAIVSATIE